MTRVRFSLIASVLLVVACSPAEQAPRVSESIASPSTEEPVQTTGFVSMDDGVRLHYTSVGQGDDVVIIPVGFYLEEALAPLADGRLLIFYDPRCRGRSECSDLSTVSLDRQIDDLEQLRDQLGFERVALIGWSGLGFEMAQYTLRHPDRVTRLVQISAIPPSKAIMDANGDRRSDRVDQKAMADLNRRIDAGEFENEPRELCRVYNDLTLPSNFADPIHVAEVPDVCEYENEWPKNLWPYFGALLPSFGEWDVTEEIAALDIPRLVIHGREDGVPLAGAEVWAAGENARLIVLSPAGHFPFLEKPEELIRAIDRFLDGEWPDGAV